MYIIKIEGTSKVADFIQIRDDNFALIEQIKLKDFEKKNYLFGDENIENIIKKITDSAFGEIIKI